MQGNFNSIINTPRPVLVDFHANWCGPCKAQSPILKELAAEMGDRIRVIKIDVDQNSLMASRYQVLSVPTLIVFKNGKPVWRESGVATKANLMRVITQNED